MADIETDRSLVQSMAEIIIRNTSNANERQDFWEKAEKNLLMALLHYVNDRRDPATGQLLPIEERSLGTVYHILSQNTFQEIDELVEKTFQGSIPAFIAAFTRRRKLSGEEVAEIRRMLDRYEDGEDVEG